jgi:hypothetical protein
LAARRDMIGEIKANLERCGYSDQLLQANYSYEDDAGKHSVPLVAFARPVYDSRTSCISVISSDSLYDVSDVQVYQFRGVGTPVVFVCCANTVQWWTIAAGGAELRETHPEGELREFFRARKEEFAPDRMWRAKNLGNVIKGEQLHFVDAGLMPLIEQEMGERLGSLMERVLRLLRSGFTEKQLENPENHRWIFRAAFWLLCAKILRDKGVRNFIHLDLTDVGAVLRAVTIHYSAQEPVEAGTPRQREAIDQAAGEINKFSSLSNLTTEAFAGVYEKVLVDEELRKALGIHATPSYLVDYIVWQLLPWIEQIPEDRRVILEPACGHAPFLTAAMRMLRFLYGGPEGSFHKYAQKRLIGIEVEPFAREIARLSLTMADIPNPNGWNITESNVYCEDELSKKARNAMVLLCNPPFEDFTLAERENCTAKGQRFQSFNKAAEMLWRTLPHMAHGAVFAVVLPLGLLHRRNLADLRKVILNEWELLQICTLPENVFRFARHRSVLLFGRKGTMRATDDNRVLYRRVSTEGLQRFRETYEGRDQYVLQSKLNRGPTFDLRVRELDDVWNYCESNLPRFGSICRGGQGLSYKGRDLPKGAKTFGKEEFRGAVKGYALSDPNTPLHGLPEEYWMNLAPEVIDRYRWGRGTGSPRILVNYVRVGGTPWRIKALLDRQGRPVTSAFLAFQVQDEDWQLSSLWAILNSPYANAYAYCNSMERHNLSGTIREIPVPACARAATQELEELVAEYFALMEKEGSVLGGDIRSQAKHLLLRIDAEVMRLYDLPPKMEKRVLDLFQGSQRKGVDFVFAGYYPKGFESAIPLHEYLSEEYQRSTLAFADEWVRKNRSPDVNRILREAVEAFEEEGEDA